MGHADLPLSGLRIVITRPRHQAAELAALLEAQGAEVLELPAIEIRPPSDWSSLDAALHRLTDYHWIIFTSANGVRFFHRRASQLGIDLARFTGRLCAIGPATARALRGIGWTPHLIPDEYVAESLVQSFSSVDLAGARILLPRAAVARDLVPSELARRGAMVDVVEAYRTVAPEDLPARARQLFSGSRPPDWITFTSSSTVTHFVRAVGPKLLRRVRIASIGPVTSATLRHYALEPSAEARTFTSTGLVEAIVEAVRG